jgi:hypothetical protein
MNFILKKIINKRWLSCCLLFFLMACHIKTTNNPLPVSKNDSIEEEREITAAFNTIYKNAAAVKQGDLIMRTGRDFTSEAMRQLSLKDKT